MPINEEQYNKLVAAGYSTQKIMEFDAMTANNEDGGTLTLGTGGSSSQVANAAPPVRSQADPSMVFNPRTRKMEFANALEEYKYKKEDKKPTLAENVKLASTDNVLNLINELQGMYGKDGKGVDFATEATANLSRVPVVGDAFFAGSQLIPGTKEKKEQRQNFTDVVTNLNNNMLYLKSGAQINDKEFQRLTTMMPGRWGRKNVLDVKQLGRLQREFDILKSRIEQGVKWNSKQKKFLNPDGSEYDMADVDKQVSSLDTEEDNDGGVNINEIFGKRQ